MRLFHNSYIKLALAGAIILATAGVYSLSGNTTMTVEAVTSTAAALPASNSSNPASSAGSIAPTNVSSQPASAPSCQQGSYTPPSPPAVNAAQPGMHQNIQNPAYYTVYGNTASEVNNQIANCTPVDSDGDRFAASTDYAINWAFSFMGDDSGLCRVTAASVGINIGVVYPNWQPTSGAAAGLNTSWQRFITNLATHENGHVRIDQAGAAQLLADLQNFPATDCNTIVAQATAKASSSIQAINQANDSYDAATNHGATQGAALN